MGYAEGNTQGYTREEYEADLKEQKEMMDYEEALLQVTDVLKTHNRHHMNTCHKRAVETIRRIVTPKGKWVHIYDDFYTCSICNRGICTDWETEPYKHYPFCHCGNYATWDKTER